MPEALDFTPSSGSAGEGWGGGAFTWWRVRRADIMTSTPPQPQEPTPLAGLIVVDKPHRLSSTSVVRVIKRRARGAKTGHAGTLDPLASGILICCLGRATRCVERIMAMPKTYECTIDLAALSTTQDLEGEITPIKNPAQPTPEAIVQMLADRFTGTILQTPPQHSAMRVDGKRAYTLARKGREFTLEARPIRIDAIDVLAYDWPSLTIRTTCGRGTYIRSLAQDIGQSLNVGGYLTALRRTAVGPFTLDRAYPLDAVPDPLEQHHLIDIDEVS